ncbi:MAG: MerR family transcriptional regulator [Desulfovibrionaceae bacterium]|nr:MerR family transcriptional regulator [Desulfovibrionaceae bacterium]
MSREKRYSIGEMSEICKISKKTLRYYDEIGIVTPCRNDYNNYRYYTEDALLSVLVLKYYKQMGFTLNEMRSFFEGAIPNIYNEISASFQKKIAELTQEKQKIENQHASVCGWYDLIREAQMVIENNIHEVSVRYVEPSKYIYLDYQYNNDIKSIIINLDFTNFVEKQENMIVGPVIVQFSSFDERLNDRPQPVRLMQKTLLPCADAVSDVIGGTVMASCYHIGCIDGIGSAYRRIARWAEQQGYCLGKGSYERYVTDYWTTSNSEQHVTEVMVAIHRRCESSV